MSLTERLALLVSADTDQAVRGLQKMERQADRAIGKTTTRVDKLGVRMTKMGAAMLAGGALAAVGLAKAAGAASDLAESTGQTEQIFGSAADEIGQFAKNAATAMGQSERAARDATSEFGLLLDNFGLNRTETVKWSKDLTLLASDMASFKNTSPEEAVVALGAALRGESEPIRRYGVMLDDATVKAKAVELGLAETTSEVSNAAKIQARLNLIMESTVTIQGDFERTADGMANKTRTAKSEMEDFTAALGTAMLPVMEQVIGAGSDMLGWFNDLEPAQQKAVSTAATWGTGLLLVGGAVSTTTGKVIKMRKSIQATTTAMRAMSAAQLASGVGTVAALAAVVTGIVLLGRSTGDTNTAIAVMRRELDSLRTDSVDSLAATFDKQTGAATESTSAYLAQQLAVFGTVQALDAAGVSMDDIITKLDASVGATDSAKSAIARFAQGLYTSGQLTGEQGSALLALRTAYFEAKDQAVATSKVLGEFGDTAEDVTEDIDDLKQSWSDLVDLFIADTASVAEANLMIEEFGESTRDLRDDNGDLTQSLAESRVEFFKMGAEIATQAEEMKKAGVPAADIAKFLGDGKAAVLGFGDAAGLSLPDILEMGHAMDALDRTIDAELRVSVTGDSIPSVFDGARVSAGVAGFRAKGGPVSAGRPYVVGERGPEIMVPGASGTVIPNSAIAGGGGGGETRVTVIELDGQVLAEVMVNTGRFSGGTIL